MNDEILDKLPPQDKTAEQGILGSMLLDADVIDEVLEVAGPENCYVDGHRKIFECLAAMRKDGAAVDATLVQARLKERGTLAAAGGTAYIAELIQAVPHVHNAVYYAKIVREKSQKRALLLLGEQLFRDAHDDTLPAEQAITTAVRQLDAMGDRGGGGEAITAEEAVVRTFNYLDGIQQQGGELGLATGLVDFDREIGGLFPGELVILAARPGVGKTALALQVLSYSAATQREVLMFSLEMDVRQLICRMLGAMGEINANHIRLGTLTADDTRRLQEAAQRLSGYTFSMGDNSSVTIAQIEREARRAARHDDLRLLIVDYLQLIKAEVRAGEKESRQEQVANMAKALKRLARELQVPVLCVCQLNRQGESGGAPSPPRLSHLRESGAIEQDADVVVFLHRDESSRTVDPFAPRCVKLILEKNRNGPTGEWELYFEPRTTSFRKEFDDGI